MFLMLFSEKVFLQVIAATKASSTIASNITISYRNSSFILSYHRMNVDEAS